MLLLDDPEGSNPSSPLANPSPPLLGPGPRHRWPRCDLLFFFLWLLPVWKISNGAAFVFCPIWTLVRYWRWFVRSCTEVSPCKGLCKLVKRLTRSSSSRTTIAAAGAFVGVDRVDPVRRFGRSQSVKIVEAAAAVTVICGRSSRRFSTSPPVTAADVVLLIRVTISRPARPARAGPRPGGHPCLARRTEVNAAGGFFDHPLWILNVSLSLFSTHCRLYPPILHLLSVLSYVKRNFEKEKRKFFVLLVFLLSPIIKIGRV